MTTKLSLDALRVLESIHRLGSFAAAAEELHRVRSALTYTMQKLERDLDIEIIDRSNYRIQLTPLGKTLLQQGNELLRTANDIERNIQRIKTGWETEIYIAIDDTISIEKIFPLLQKFYTVCSWTQVHLNNEILNGCWDALSTGRVDLAIGVSGEAPLSREYGIMPLGLMKFVFAVAPQHPLASLGEPLKTADIIKYHSIIAADSSRQLPPRTVGTVSGQPTLTVSNMAAKIAAQKRGLGVGYLPLHLIQNDIKTKKLIIKKVQKAKPTSSISTAWRLSQAGKAIQWWLKELSDSKIRKTLVT